MNRRLLQALAVGVCLAACFLFTGCWDYIDIDRRGIILGLGVDAEGLQQSGDPLLRVTVEVVNPAGGGGGVEGGSAGGGTNNSLLITRKAASMVQAMELVETSLDRHLFLPFLQSMVFGEQLARSGLGSVFDYIAREPTFRLTVCLFVTPDSPEALLQFSPVLATSPGMWLRSLADNFRDTPRMMPCVPAWQYRKDMQEVVTALLPRVYLPGGESGRPVVEGAAVMHNHRLVGWLDPFETEGAHWWRNEVDGGAVTVPCRQGYVTMEVRKVGGKMLFHGEASSLSVTLELRARGAIREFGVTCPLLGEEVTNDPEIKAALANAIRERAQAAHDAARRIGFDFLGIGRELKLRRPDLWQQLKPDRGQVPEVEVLNIPVHIEVIPAIAEYGRQRY